jgi:hypothetical protein
VLIKLGKGIRLAILKLRGLRKGGGRGSCVLRKNKEK